MKNTFYKFSLIAILIGLFTNTQTFAQENEAKNFKMLYKFYTTKLPDNSRLLEVSFIAQDKKDRKNKVPVYDAEINFYNVTDEEDILLGTVKTDKNGEAKLTVPPSQEYLKDAEGYINLEAVFNKTKAIKRYKKSVAVKDLFIDLNLEEVDSVKTAFINVSELDSLNTKVLVEEDIDAIVSIQGLLSRMPIEEAWIEGGEYEFEFPTDLPGNENGMLDVYVKVDDHDEYGTVIQKQTVEWGTFNQTIEDDSNKLWSEVAPIWMYVVLTILLVGVWANYAWSIKHLMKIKKEGDEIVKKEIS